MKTTQKIVFSSMLAALVCVATMIIKLPSPLGGYINLGDCIVLLIASLMAPGYGFFAAAIGSSLADIFSGYAVYAPATFIIKGVMVLIAYGTYKLLSPRVKPFLSRSIGGILAELFMILGYYIFEGFLYGFGAVLVNIPANAVQGLAGIIIGMLLIKLFEKNKIFNHLN